MISRLIVCISCTQWYLCFILFFRWFRTGRIRNGTKRNRKRTLGSFTSSSGGSVSGSTWWSMTGCRRWTESWCTATPMTGTSSGARWWRKPTPSEPLVIFYFLVCFFNVFVLFLLRLTFLLRASFMICRLATVTAL